MDLTTDIADITTGFEEELRFESKTDVEIVDGYAEPKYAEDQVFKGVILPRRRWTPFEQGVRLEGTSFLIVRLNQPGCPDLKVGDIIIDSNNKRWKIVDEEDYSKHGKGKVFGLTKVSVA